MKGGRRFSLHIVSAWKRNKGGFTLVEMIVVLVIIGIMAAGSAAGILAYRKWSVWQQQENYARTLFSAAQSALTQYSVNGRLEDIQKTVEQKAGCISKDGGMLIGITDGDGSAVSAGDIWTQGGSDGSLYYITGTPAQYAAYRSNPESDELEKILYDIFDAYLYDKEILARGCISIEFDPAAGMVYSVVYSDRAQSLHYGGGSGLNIADRSESARKGEIPFGYYGVETLAGASSANGRPVISNVKLNNEETLNLTWKLSKYEDAAELLNYQVILHDAKTKETLLKLEFNDASKEGTTAPNASGTSIGYYRFAAESASDASLKLMWATVTRYEKSASGAAGREAVANVLGEYPFLIYMDADRKVTLVLDAVDLEATEKAYLDSRKGDDEAFRDSLSLHRFGLESFGTEEIYCTIQGSGLGYKLTALKQSNVEHMYFGEYTEPRQAADSEDGNRLYELDNARHLYNIRFTEAVDSSNADMLDADAAEIIPADYRLTRSFAWGYGEEPEEAASILAEGRVYVSGLPVTDADSQSSEADSKDEASLPGYAAFPSITSLREGSTFASQENEEDTVYTIEYLYLSAQANRAASGGSSRVYYAAGRDMDNAGSGVEGTALFVDNQGDIFNVVLGHLTVDGRDNTAGFCAFNGGTLSSLEVGEGSRISGRFQVAGIFAGVLPTQETPRTDYVYEDLINRADVAGTAFVGGITGSLRTGKEINCASSVSISGCENYGAVVGRVSTEKDEETDFAAGEQDAPRGPAGTDMAESWCIGGIIGFAENEKEDETSLVISDCISAPRLWRFGAGETEEDGQGLAERLSRSAVGMYVGGIAGFTDNAVLKQCSTVSGQEEPSYVCGYAFVGGIVGYYTGSAELSGACEDGNGKNQANVAGYYYTGGIAGANAALETGEDGAAAEDTRRECLPALKKEWPAGEAAVISNWINEGTVTALGGPTEDSAVRGAFAGGITGFNTGTILDCSSIAGEENSDPVFAPEDCGDYVGGLAGYNNGVILATQQQTVVSAVSARYYAGGLVGYNDVNARICNYGIGGGYVYGSTFVGGYTGFNASVDFLTACGSLSGSADEVSGEYLTGGIIGAGIVALSEDIRAGFPAQSLPSVLDAGETGAFIGGFAGYYGAVEAGRFASSLECSDYLEETAAAMAAALEDIVVPSRSEEEANGECTLPDAQTLFAAFLTAEEALESCGTSYKLTLTGAEATPEEAQGGICEISGGLYTGGVIGCCYRDASMEISGIINRSNITARQSVRGYRDGEDGAHWHCAYAGAIIGEVTPKVVLRECGSAQEAEVLAKQATCSGGLAEINFGEMLSCTAVPQSYDSRYAGGLAGVNIGLIEDCTVSGLFSGVNVGGVTAWNYGVIRNPLLVQTVIMAAGSSAGGVTAKNCGEGSIEFTKEAAAVLDVSIEGTAAAVGGLAGCNEGTLYAADGLRIQNLPANAVAGEEYAGGFVGRQCLTADSGQTAVMPDGFENYASVTAHKGSAGGVIGELEAAGAEHFEIGSCINYGRVSGGDCAGGLIGSFYAPVSAISVEVRYCQNHGYISAAGSAQASWAGGIAGADREPQGMTLLVADCVNTGLLLAKGAAGGIIGGSFGTQTTVEHCQNYGLGAEGCADFAGIAAVSCTVKDCIGAACVDTPVAKGSGSDGNYYFLAYGEDALPFGVTQIGYEGSGVTCAENTNTIDGISFACGKDLPTAAEENRKFMAAFSKEITLTQLTLDWYGGRYRYGVELLGQDGVWRDVVTDSDSGTDGKVIHTLSDAIAVKGIRITVTDAVFEEDSTEGSIILQDMALQGYFEDSSQTYDSSLDGGLAYGKGEALFAQESGQNTAAVIYSSDEVRLYELALSPLLLEAGRGNAGMDTSLTACGDGSDNIRYQVWKADGETIRQTQAAPQAVQPPTGLTAGADGDGVVFGWTKGLYAERYRYRVTWYEDAEHTAEAGSIEGITPFTDVTVPKTYRGSYVPYIEITVRSERVDGEAALHSEWVSAGLPVAAKRLSRIAAPSVTAGQQDGLLYGIRWEGLADEEELAALKQYEVVIRTKALIADENGNTSGKQELVLTAGTACALENVNLEAFAGEETEVLINAIALEGQGGYTDSEEGESCTVSIPARLAVPRLTDKLSLSKTYEQDGIVSQQQFADLALTMEPKENVNTGQDGRYELVLELYAQEPAAEDGTLREPDMVLAGSGRWITDSTVIAETGKTVAEAAKAVREQAKTDAEEAKAAVTAKAGEAAEAAGEAILSPAREAAEQARQEAVREAEASGLDELSAAARGQEAWEEVMLAAEEEAAAVRAPIMEQGRQEAQAEYERILAEGEAAAGRIKTDLAKADPITMEGSLERAVYTIRALDGQGVMSGLDIGYAAGYIRVSMRAVSDSAVSSPWTDEYYGADSEDKAAVFRLPAVRLDAPEVTAVSALVSRSYDRYVKTDNGSWEKKEGDTVTVGQNSFSFPAADEAWGYRVELVSNPRTQIIGNTEYGYRDAISFLIQKDESGKRPSGYFIRVEGSTADDHTIEVKPGEEAQWLIEASKPEEETEVFLYALPYHVRVFYMDSYIDIGAWIRQTNTRDENGNILTSFDIILPDGTEQNVSEPVRPQDTSCLTVQAYPQEALTLPAQIVSADHAGTQRCFESGIYCWYRPDEQSAARVSVLEQKREAVKGLAGAQIQESSHTGWAYSFDVEGGSYAGEQELRNGLGYILETVKTAADGTKQIRWLAVRWRRSLTDGSREFTAFLPESGYAIRYDAKNGRYDGDTYDLSVRLSCIYPGEGLSEWTDETKEEQRIVLTGNTALGILSQISAEYLETEQTTVSAEYELKPEEEGELQEDTAKEEAAHQLTVRSRRISWDWTDSEDKVSGFEISLSLKGQKGQTDAIKWYWDLKEWQRDQEAWTQKNTAAPQTITLLRQTGRTQEEETSEEETTEEETTEGQSADEEATEEITSEGQSPGEEITEAETTEAETAGTQEQATETSETQEQATETAGTQEQATETPGTQEQATETAGTQEQATETSGTQEQIAETAGTQEPSAQTESADIPAPETQSAEPQTTEAAALSATVLQRQLILRGTSQQTDEDGNSIFYTAEIPVTLTVTAESAADGSTVYRFVMELPYYAEFAQAYEDAGEYTGPEGEADALPLTLQISDITIRKILQVRDRAYYPENMLEKLLPGN